MNLRLLFVVALGIMAGLSAPRSEAARSIRTDPNINCTGPAPTAVLNVKLGTGDTANPGVGALPVWVCDDTDPATQFSDLPFNSTTSTLYTWTAIGTDPVGFDGLSAFDSSNIVAMVDVFNLTGTYKGDTEVDFSYNLSSGCPASSASLTWSGKTYDFSSPCNAPLMFFNSDGNEIAAPVPEPDTLVLMCLAVPLLLWAWRRKRLARAQGWK